MKAGKSRHEIIVDLTKKEKETFKNLTVDERKVFDKFINEIYERAVMEGLELIERIRTRLKPKHDIHKCDVCRAYRDGLKILGIIIDQIKKSGVKQFRTARLTRRVHERK